MSDLLDIHLIQQFQQNFVSERDWQKFHTVKNLILALTGEVGELSEIFQWLSAEEIENLKTDALKKEKVCDEIADILYYLIRVSDLLEINLSESFWNKMKKNTDKYPVHLAKGKNLKYTELN